MQNQSEPKQRRGPGLVRHVMKIALLEIADGGFDRLSIERVATRSGVNKTTIYRRWPTPESLASAALDFAADGLAPPDTGTLKGDLAEYVLRLQRASANPLAPALLRFRLGGVPEGMTQDNLRVRFNKADNGAMLIFERARDRGELGPSTDLVLLRDAFVGMSHYLQVVATVEPERIAELFLSGAATKSFGSEH